MLSVGQHAHIFIGEVVVDENIAHEADDGTKADTACAAGQLFKRGGTRWKKHLQKVFRIGRSVGRVHLTGNVPPDGQNP